MAQFNLLPDVKLQFVRARRLQYLVTVVSFIVGGVALALFAAMFVWVNVSQKRHITNLNKDVKRYSVELKNVRELDKILTVQNQLRTLPGLHEDKAAVSRVYDYLAQVTPVEVSLNKLTADFEGNTLSVGGTAPTLDNVRKYTDTLKVTKYALDTQPATEKAFQNVVLSSFGRDDKGATFTITLGYDPIIFNITRQVQFSVPSGVMSTQTNLFQGGN